MDSLNGISVETSPLLTGKEVKTYATGPQDSLAHTQVTLLGNGQVQADLSAKSTDIGQDAEAASTFSLGGLSRRQKITLVLLAAANFFSGCGFSLLAPFFPQEAAKKGVSNTVTGLIFGSFQLVIFLFSPIFGNYISKIGPKFMFVSGIFVGGSCAALFGVLDKSPSGNTFIIMCFTCRSVEALGLAGLLTASFAIISNEFPKYVATVFGILETASGIGLMVGPAIGGVLYQVGGFGLPFYTMGGLIILTGVLVFKFLPDIQDSPNQKKQGGFRLLTSIYVWVCMIIIFAASTGISFTDPTLSPHLEEFHLSTSVIGLVFTIAPALYGVTAPLYGYLCDSKGYTFSLLIVGNLVCGFGYLLLGPSPYLPFLPSKLWIVIVAMSLLGLFLGCAVIPVVKCMLMAACDIGFENNLDTYGLVSGLFNSVWCFGGFVGPVLGGLLVNEVGFNKAASLIALLSFFSVLCTAVFFFMSKMKSSPNTASLEVSYSQIVDASVTPSQDTEHVVFGDEANNKQDQREPA